MKGIISGVQSLGTVDGPGVRFVVFAAGCPLRCAYCHNPETWEKRGEEIDAEALAEKILRFKPYIKNGGVTLSGGEPLMQGEFFAALAAILKRESLSVALDTSGNYFDEHTEKLVDLCDLFLLDVKFDSEEDYRRFTGGSSESRMRCVLPDTCRGASRRISPPTATGSSWKRATGFTPTSLSPRAESGRGWSNAGWSTIPNCRSLSASI